MVKDTAVDFAEAGFTDLVAGGRATIVVAKIRDIIEQKHADEETIGGIADLHIIKELTPGRLSGAGQIRMHFAQYSEPLQRIKNPVGWNTVEVQKETLLLVGIAGVVPQTASPEAPVMTAAAVQPLQSADDEYVRGVEQAILIEQAEDVTTRKNLIRKGLHSELAFFNGYATMRPGAWHALPAQMP